MPSYAFSRTLDADIDTADARAREALGAAGFGILTEIDMAATFKVKLDVDIPAYRILGACNPPLAHKAVQAEPHIGTMLPCNVILRDVGGGQTEVSAVDPVASMSAIDNDALGAVAMEVRQRLQDVIATM